MEDLMKKQFILMLSIIVFATPHVQANDQSWFEYFVSLFYETKQDTYQAPKQQPPQPSAPPLEDIYYTQKQPAASGISGNQRAQVQRDVEEIIDRLFARSDQDQRTQLEIDVIKEKTVRCVHERTQAARTVHELRQGANYYLTDCLATTVAYNARLLYDQLAKKLTSKAPYNPHLASSTENEIKNYALKAISNNERGVLAFFVGDALKQRIANKIARDYAPAPKPSAPPLEQLIGNDIYEVYMHENAQRYEQTIQKIQQGKVYRADECPICMKDFGGTVKRATLGCGHTVCVTCLYTMLYKSNKKECPLCRDAIHSDEFPSSHLAKHLPKQ